MLWIFKKRNENNGKENVILEIKIRYGRKILKI